MATPIVIERRWSGKCPADLVIPSRPHAAAHAISANPGGDARPVDRDRADGALAALAEVRRGDHVGNAGRPVLLAAERAASNSIRSHVGAATTGAALPCEAAPGIKRPGTASNHRRHGFPL